MTKVYRLGNLHTKCTCKVKGDKKRIAIRLSEKFWLGET